ncbi:MAG: hypothetical protein QOG09_561 [Solirubrobacterales bacterium]|nr:hypothetical protein [Solirubrobacterales bacterium]
MRRKGSEASNGARFGLLALGCVAALGGVGAIAGCGSSTSVTGTNAQIAEPVATVQISESEYKISPAKVKVPRSGRISIQATNAGQEYHALHVIVPGKVSAAASPEQQTAQSEIGEIDPGNTETLNIQLKPGTYTWYCPLSNHRRLGMVGKLIVR